MSSIGTDINDDNIVDILELLQKSDGDTDSLHVFDTAATGSTAADSTGPRRREDASKLLLSVSDEDQLCRTRLELLFTTPNKRLDQHAHINLSAFARAAENDSGDFIHATSNDSVIFRDSCNEDLISEDLRSIEAASPVNQNREFRTTSLISKLESFIDTAPDTLSERLLWLLLSPLALFAIFSMEFIFNFRHVNFDLQCSRQSTWRRTFTSLCTHATTTITRATSKATFHTLALIRMQKDTITEVIRKNGFAVGVVVGVAGIMPLILAPAVFGLTCVFIMGLWSWFVLEEIKVSL